MTFRQEGRVGWLLIIGQMFGWCVTIATLIRVLEKDSKNLGLLHSSNGPSLYEILPHEAIIHEGVSTKPTLLPSIRFGHQK